MIDFNPCESGQILSISSSYSTQRGFDMGRMLRIPPPVLEENRTEYLEELSEIKQAEDWVEKHSSEDYSNHRVKEDEHDTLLSVEHDQPRPTITAFEIIGVVILICFLISLPFILIGLFLHVIFSSGGGGCFGVCGLSGWGGP